MNSLWAEEAACVVCSSQVLQGFATGLLLLAQVPGLHGVQLLAQMSS